MILELAEVTCWQQSEPRTRGDDPGQLMSYINLTP